MLDWGHRDVWMYHFAHLGNVTTVGHFSEVPYVFQNCNSCGVTNQTCCQGSSGNASDTQLSLAMGRYWTSFATHGDPNAPRLPHWPRYHHNRTMMKLDLPLVLQSNYRGEYCRFWDSVYASENIGSIQQSVPFLDK